MLKNVDALFYRQLTALLPPAAPQPPLLLVEVDIPLKQGEEWQQLMQEIIRHNPRLMVITDPPNPLPVSLINLAGKEKIVFGHPTSGWKYRDTTLDWGINHLPPGEDGLYRRQWLSRPVVEQIAPTLAARVAQLLQLPTPANTDNFLVHFGWHSGKLPWMGAQRLLREGVPAVLVKDRLVIIGTRGEDATLFIPAGEESISPLAFHGHALATLLSQSILTDTPPLLSLLLLIVITVIQYTLLARLSPTSGVLFVPLFALFLLAITFAALRLLLFWLPLAAMLLLTLLVFILGLVQRERETNKLLNDMLLVASTRLSERNLPTDLHEAENPWPHIIHFVDQTLSLTRGIFLEKIAGDHRVREVISLATSINEILERRRDFQRFPYTTAITENGPFRLPDHRLFLPPLPNGSEVQFLTPLMVGGDVLGFWAFGVEEQVIRQTKGFLEAVGNFADQIALALHQREIWRQTGMDGSTPANRRLSVELTLRKSLSLLEQRFSHITYIFEHLGVATALYDLFGRVVLINRRMSQLLTTGQFTPFAMTALDLTVALTGESAESIRNILRYLILVRRPVTLPVKAGILEKGCYHLLQLRPVEGAERREDASKPFQIEGILLELVDVTETRNLLTLQEMVVTKVNQRLDNDLESLLVATSLLENPRLPESRRERVAKLLKDKLHSLSQALLSSASLLSSRHLVDNGERYPIHALAILHEAVDTIHPAMGVTFNLTCPEISSLAFSSPKELKEIFQLLLNFLMQDAMQDSKIAITVTEEEKILRVAMSNSGFGMPDQRFQSLIANSDQGTNQDFQNIKTAMSRADGWHGQLIARSQLGEGTFFELILEVYH